MSATRVQGPTVIASTTTITVGSAQGWATPTAGNYIVVVYNGTQTITALTGYTAGPSVVDDNAAYVYWKVAAGTETSISVTQAGATAAIVTVFEVAGLAAFDLFNSAANTRVSGTTTTAASITTTGTSGDWVLAVGALCRDTTGTTFPTGLAWTNSYTTFNTQQTAVSGGGAADCYTSYAELDQATAGATSTAASWTNAWFARQHLIIAFKLAAVAAPAAPPPGILFIGPCR